MHNQARGSTIGASFKTDPSASHLDEEDIPALGKHFKYRPGDRLPTGHGDLDEEAPAIAHDVENAIGRLITPRVAIKERGMAKNAGVLLRRIEIGNLALRIQEMHPDVRNTPQSRSV